MYVNPTEYVPSNQCSEGNKPVVPDTSKSCNSFVCFPAWDTKEGLNVSKLLNTKSEGGSLKFFVSVFQLQEYSQDLGSYAHCSKSPPTSSPSPPFPPPFQSQPLNLKLSLSPWLLDVVQVLKSNVWKRSSIGNAKVQRETDDIKMPITAKTPKPRTVSAKTHCFQIGIKLCKYRNDISAERGLWWTDWSKDTVVLSNQWTRRKDHGIAYHVQIQTQAHSAALHHSFHSVIAFKSSSFFYSSSFF